MATASDVAAASGVSGAKVSKYWSTLVSALAAEGINTPATQAAMAGTLAVETAGTFLPISEYGAVSYFDKYEPGTSIGRSLGNTQPGDGYRYRGRGFIQLTGRANYRAYGKRIGVDLEGNPDLALSAPYAARIFAAYFKDKGVAAAADAGDWQKVRKLVNGGLNGYDRFIGVVNKLIGAVAPVTATGAVNPVFLLALTAALVALLGLKGRA